MYVKKYGLGFLLFLISVVFVSAQKNGGIQINIINTHNDKGYILVNLFRDGNGYPANTDKAFRKAKINIYHHSASVLFSDLPSGNYAVAILHDENEDLKMNKNFWGLPKEGFGFSNNVMGTFGPPSFSKSGFHYTANTLVSLTIRMRY